jgi:hypothetical protein
MYSDAEANLPNLDSWVKAVPPNLVDSFNEPEPPIIFLGSGFGKEAVPPLKTGEQLAELLRAELNVKDNWEDLAELLQYLQNSWAGSKRDVILWLKKRLSYEESKPGGAYRLLLKLPANEFLTTNYDSLLSNAALEIDYVLHIIDQPGSYKTSAGQYRKKKGVGVLGRLHGGFGTAEEHIVATTDDYIENYNERGHGWTDLLVQHFQDRRMIFIGYSIRDFTTWTSLISVLQKSKESKGGIHTHFLVSPVNSHHYSNFWNRYNISHIPLKAYQFLAAMHKRLGNMDDKNDGEEIAIAAAAACTHKTYDEFLPEIELFRKQHAYPTKRIAAMKWLRKGCDEDK